jgi:hypothetical protein
LLLLYLKLFLLCTDRFNTVSSNRAETIYYLYNNRQDNCSWVEIYDVSITYTSATVLGNIYMLKQA